MVKAKPKTICTADIHASTRLTVPLDQGEQPVAREPNATHVNIRYGSHQNFCYPSCSTTSHQNEAPW